MKKGVLFLFDYQEFEEKRQEKIIFFLLACYLKSESAENMITNKRLSENNCEPIDRQCDQIGVNFCPMFDCLLRAGFSN
jgi:hypothetical protein